MALPARTQLAAVDRTIAQAFARQTSSEAEVPEWIHVCPAGPVVEGRDGRRFRVDDPQAAIDATELPAMFDLDHMSFFGWFTGGDSRAYCWVDRIEYEAEDTDERSAGFWAHVECFTPDGEQLVRTRGFRGVSPVVRLMYPETESHDAADEALPVLQSFVNFAFTNLPNLRLDMLNRMQPHVQQTETPMTKEQREALAKKLGLSPNCTDAELHTALHSRLDAPAPSAPAPAALPPSTHSVPRSDLDVALARATAAEAELRTVRSGQHTAAVSAALERFSRERKIAPASRTHYENLAHSMSWRKDESGQQLPDVAGLESFTKLMESAPVILAGDDDAGVREEHSADTKAALTKEQREVAHALGLTEEEFAKAR